MRESKSVYKTLSTSGAWGVLIHCGAEEYGDLCGPDDAFFQTKVADIAFEKRIDEYHSPSGVRKVFEAMMDSRSLILKGSKVGIARFSKSSRGRKSFLQDWSSFLVGLTVACLDEPWMTSQTLSSVKNKLNDLRHAAAPQRGEARVQTRHSSAEEIRMLRGCCRNGLQLGFILLSDLSNRRRAAALVYATSTTRLWYSYVWETIFSNVVVSKRAIELD